MTARKYSEPDLSVIITVHAEGILLHRTLASVRRALTPLISRGAITEIIIHCDNPNAASEDYLKVNKSSLKDVRIFTNHFGDLGSSRNFAVRQARGKYLTFIDADDLVSGEWYVRAYNFLESQELGAYIAHTELTVEFASSDSIIIKHGEIDQTTDTLLSVYANRWNSIIMAPRKLLLEEPYTANKPGYGYEDWHLNCRFIYRGVHNVIIPETVIFVRRKDAQSEWLRQRLTRSVLPANPLFSFAHIRSLPLQPSGQMIEQSSSKVQQVKNVAAPILQKLPLAERYARRLYHLARQVKQRTGEATKAATIPTWLSDEWRAIHAIEKQIFLSDELRHTITNYDSLTPEHYQTGNAYKEIVDHTTHDQYSYILFVPWLTKGGADLVAIHLANMVHELNPQKKIMVVATLDHESPWSTKLADGIDFIPFGTIATSLSQDVKFRLLEQLIENSGAQFLHIINSELGYDFAISHEHYIRSTDKRLIATSFSQSTNDTGQIFGYSHTHVPKVYELATLITTDNAAVANMWVKDYGFDIAKIQVHHQPVIVPKLDMPKRPLDPKKLRILWAARVCPEKQPQLVATIGRLLTNHPISIDMYGTIDHGFDQSFLASLPNNVHYKGPFDGFFTLSLQEYDAYLYTSLFDGMPNAILEAAAAQLPIVSAAVGGISTFISDRENGLLVEDISDAQAYADRLLYLLHTPDFVAQAGPAINNLLRERHATDNYRKQIRSFLKQIGY